MYIKYQMDDKSKLNGLLPVNEWLVVPDFSSVSGLSGWSHHRLSYLKPGQEGQIYYAFECGFDCL
jgi:hypothetical protein